jgi:hypothetical protein
MTDRNSKGQFLPGSPGRKRGSRNRLQADFIYALGVAIPISAQHKIMAVDRELEGDAILGTQARTLIPKALRCARTWRSRI